MTRIGRNGSIKRGYQNNGNLTCDLITVVDNGVTSNHHLKISYDESGRPLVITYKNRSYYYLLNAQGDVMGISGVYGDLKVAYTYDAWGNVLSVTGPMADALGYWNPCRYRGYVYDNETQLYYLQSRYYNPEVGRFINADSLVSTGQGMLGNNMFAYCNNNPVNLLDPTGTVCCAFADDNQLLHLNLQIYFRGGGESYSGGGVSNRGRRVSIKDLDSSDPEVVFENLEKYGMASYNGIPVIELSFLDRDAFSFGIIFMGDDVSSREDPIQTLQHEYGHAVHFKQIGIGNYTTFVAIPSVVGYWTKVPTEKYYSQPYEYIADVLGGVKRTYYGNPYPYSISTTAAAAYWILTLIAP